MTKKEKKKQCSYILNTYNINDKVKPVDEVFLLDIFKNHENWKLKKGVGINFISIGETKYKNRCFILNRIDGTKTDISFISSLTRNTKLQDIKKACRNAISDIILDYRNKNVVYGKTRCEVSNEILTQGYTHIDHYDLTFIEVFNKWFKNKDINIVGSKLNKSIDNNIDTYFTCNKLKNEFIEFHNRNTHLRAVTKEINLSYLKDEQNRERENVLTKLRNEYRKKREYNKGLEKEIERLQRKFDNNSIKQESERLTKEVTRLEKIRDRFKEVAKTFDISLIMSEWRFKQIPKNLTLKQKINILLYETT